MLGKNSKKQACVYRLCAWKNPSGKRIKPGTAPVAAPPIAPDATTSPAPVRYVKINRLNVYSVNEKSNIKYNPQITLYHSVIICKHMLSNNLKTEPWPWQ